MTHTNPLYGYVNYRTTQNDAGRLTATLIAVLLTKQTHTEWYRDVNYVRLPMIPGAVGVEISPRSTHFARRPQLVSGCGATGTRGWGPLGAAAVLTSTAASRRRREMAGRPATAGRTLEQGPRQTQTVLGDLTVRRTSRLALHERPLHGERNNQSDVSSNMGGRS